ncbi:unnamed protein product [Prorocentrum cordatum]|uniref:Uncharacterized protein n=1 Tax=Prorocentrum cordatum TaxID=2364126 RepID=A0ABN9TEN1_9DINO|nr:unnamed protein product [Polarella glacialis]
MQEWSSAINNYRMRTYLHMMGFRADDVLRFIRLLCKEAPEHKIDIDTFIRGCMHLKGPASCFDMQTMLASIQSVDARIQSNFVAMQRMLSYVNMSRTCPDSKNRAQRRGKVAAACQAHRILLSPGLLSLGHPAQASSASTEQSSAVPPFSLVCHCASAGILPSGLDVSPRPLSLPLIPGTAWPMPAALVMRRSGHVMVWWSVTQPRGLLGGSRFHRLAPVSRWRCASSNQDVSPPVPRSDELVLRTLAGGLSLLSSPPFLSGRGHFPAPHPRPLSLSCEATGCRTPDLWHVLTQVATTRPCHSPTARPCRAAAREPPTGTPHARAAPARSPSARRRRGGPPALVSQLNVQRWRSSPKVAFTVQLFCF